MSEPRYKPMGLLAPGHIAICEDCGLLVADTGAHTRFHSILASHAWALAVLQTSHINEATHSKYDTYQKIKSRRFDNWSGDALAEVMASLPDDEDDAGEGEKPWS